VLAVDRFVSPRGYAYPEDFAPENDAGYAIPLADLAGRRASLVLGEPGAGKTTALRNLADVLTRGTDAVRLLDLRDCYSEASLESAFDRVEETNTEEGRSRILLLDSVDETRVLIRTFVRFLERRLGALMQNGWRIIAACRTAESVRALDELFEELDPGAVHVLLPLQRANVVSIADSLGVDSEEFLREVGRHRLQSLAATPLTLSLLFTIFRADGRFPDSRGRVFERAISLMSGEDAVDRYTPIPHEEAFPIRQRAAVERLAAFSTFSEVGSFALFNVGEPSVGLQTERLLGTERVEGTRLELTNHDLQSALRTSLFATTGFNERQFSHRQLKDFLAANHIHRAGLSHSALRSVLTVAETMAIPPQMADVATWLVAQQPDDFKWLLDADPLTLVRNRITDDLPHLARDMVGRLLERAEEVDRALAWRDELSGLRYPEMAADFEQYLAGPETTQVVALRILRDSYVPGLEKTLLALLEDCSTALRVRERVAEVVRTHRVAVVLSRVNLRDPELFAGDDHQELRGSLLAALWPDFITPKELVGALVEPREHFVGSYYLFLSQLSQNVSLDLASVLLDWWASSLDRRSETDDGFDDEFNALGGTIDAAVTCALSAEDLPADAMVAVARVVAYRLGRGRDRLPFSRSEVVPTALRDLVTRLVALEEGDLPLWFVVLSARDADNEPLVSSSDLPWLKERAMEAPAQELDAWMNLLDRLLDPTNDLDMAWAWGQQETPLWARLRRYFDPIDLGSDVATHARAIWEMNHRSAPDVHSRAMSPEEYVSTVRRIMLDVQNEPTRFWLLARWLDVDLELSRYVHDPGPDLLSTENIALFSDRERTLILDLARDYIGALTTPERPFPMRLKRNTIYFGIQAAYRALHTLYLHRSTDLKSVSEVQWDIANIALLEAQLGPGEADARRVRRGLLTLSDSTSPGNLARAIDAFLARIARGTSHAGTIADLDGFVRPAQFMALRRAIRAGGSDRSSLIDLYLHVDTDGATAWVRKIVLDSPDEQEIAATLSALTAFDAELGYDLLEAFCTNRPELASPILLKIAQHERFASERIRQVDPAKRVAIYVRLATLFPPETESFEPGVHAVTPREDLARWRSELLRSVAAGGTREGLLALLAANERISTVELDYALVAAREAFRVNGWSPLSIEEYSTLIGKGPARLARTSDDVLQIVLDALDEVQGWLRGETPQAFALWNTGVGFSNPKDENQISDWYCHSLRLLLGSGLIINREVEVSNAAGRGVGSRQDLRVEVRDLNTGEHLVVVVEVKGIWNRGVRSNLVTQLAGEYLTSGAQTHGIYLVVDFDSNQMTNEKNISQSDRNRRGLRAHLESQAAALPDGLRVRAVVHDASLPVRR